MPYNLTFYRTDTAEAVCLAGSGAPRSATVSTESIISQRDVDRKAVGWAKALAQSRLRCVVPSPGGGLEISPFQNFSTAGVKGGSYPTQQYVLTNNGREDVNWVFSPGNPWLTSNVTSGFLYVGESVVLTLGVDDTTLNADEQYITLFEILNVEAGVADITLSATVDVYPVPQVSGSYVSQDGTGTLIGFSEYTSPSTPPRKYRLQSLSGSTRACDFLSFSCPLSEVRGISKYTYSGSASFNASTGSPTNNSVETVDATVTNPGVGCSDAFPSGPGFPFNQTPAYNPFNPQNVSDANLVDSPTVNTWSWDGSCGVRYSYHGEVVASLSVEDTEADAIARATKTPGTSNVARTETRGPGDFDFIFRTVEVTLNSSGLATGLAYRITLDVLTEDYGGGSPVNSQHTIDFVASGPTQQTVWDVQAPYGKQVTLSNPQIIPL